MGNERIKVKLEDICRFCHVNIERSLVWDNKIKQYFDDKDILVHESVGIFIVNSAGEVLLFSLTKFPYGYTVPAGHVDSGEIALDSAIRELKEEVGVSVETLEHLGDYLMEGDSCSRGADVHKWSVYMLLYEGQKINLNEEGSEYGWFSLDELPDNLTMPVESLLSKEVIRERIMRE